MTEKSSHPPPRRLDPDAAIAARRESDPVHPAGRPAADRPVRSPPPAVDVRRYQWMIGGFGLLLVIAFSIYLWAHNGATVPGVGPGKPLHRFVAPLATSDLNASARLNPRCDPARPARRGLNVCGRTPLVLDLFATSAAPCVRSVDTLQRLAPRFPGVTLAAVAVNASRAETAALVRSHHWTIPVAYDSDGAVEQVYGVAVCPLIELARGGTVAARLIGKSWADPARLAARVTQLLR